MDGRFRDEYFATRHLSARTLVLLGFSDWAVVLQCVVFPWAVTSQILTGTYVVGGCR